MEVHSGVQGEALPGVLGAEPPEAEAFFCS